MYNTYTHRYNETNQTNFHKKAKKGKTTRKKRGKKCEVEKWAKNFLLAWLKSLVCCYWHPNRWCWRRCMIRWFLFAIALVWRYIVYVYIYMWWTLIASPIDKIILFVWNFSSFVFNIFNLLYALHRILCNRSFVFLPLYFVFFWLLSSSSSSLLLLSPSLTFHTLPIIQIEQI